MSHNLVFVVGGDEDDLIDLAPEYRDDDGSTEDESTEDDEDGEGYHFDWYVLGGRWSGYLALRPGAQGRLGERGLGDDRPDQHPDFLGRADCALLRDVDVSGMRAEAADAAAQVWDLWNEVVASTPEAESFREIEARVRSERYPSSPSPPRRWWRRGTPSAVDEGAVRLEARRRFREQPRQARLEEVFSPSQRMTFDMDISPSVLDRATYVERARLSVFCGVAVVRDGVWIERPDASLDGMEADMAWLRQHGTWPDTEPGDVTVAVVDCHR